MGIVDWEERASSYGSGESLDKLERSHRRFRGYCGRLEGDVWGWLVTQRPLLFLELLAAGLDGNAQAELRGLL
jgi:hypothetical protein